MKAKRIFVVMTMLFALASCTKQESRLYYFYGWAPILSSTSKDTLVLEQANRNAEAVRLNWSHPNYLYTNGVASQNISYALQVDTTNTFASAVLQEISLSGSTRYVFTVDELNKLLTRMSLE